MANQKKTVFTVTARINMEVSTEVMADNLTELIPKMEKLEVKDFVTIDGDAIEWELEGFTWISSGEGTIKIK